MEIMRAFSISASALTAQRFRLDIIANNLANVNTTRTAEGGPYRRKVPVFAERVEVGPDGRVSPGGVSVIGVIEDPTPFRAVYDPHHPDADKNGYVWYPNVNPVQEMVDMIDALRAYEANVRALEAAKNMFRRALEIGRG